jgi:GST-like protein
MIDVYYWTSPNVHKIMMFLEETGLEFKVQPIDVTLGEQYGAGFTKISPNSRLPAIVDHDPSGGGGPIPVFESGAILLYLAEKTCAFLSHDQRVRIQTLQWLFWQVGGLGPAGGQCVHFRNYAPQPIDYALQRFGNENLRLVSVLNRHLQSRDFIAGSYSIADMACYPWIFAHRRRDQLDLTPFPDLARWFDAIADRAGTQRAYGWVQKVLGDGTYSAGKTDLTVEARRILFGAHAV